MHVEWNLPDGVGTVHMRQHTAFACYRAKLLDRQHQARRGGDMAEDEDARRRGDRLGKQADDFIDRSGRTRQLYEVEPDAIALGLLFPAAAAAGMFLVRQK